MKTNKELSIYEVSEILRAHKKEIMRVVRSTYRDYRVLAEVRGDGTWCGVGRVTPGTGSMMAHNGTGFAVYFAADRFTSYDDIDREIDEHERQYLDILAAEEDAFHSDRER